MKTSKIRVFAPYGALYHLVDVPSDSKSKSKNGSAHLKIVSSEPLNANGSVIPLPIDQFSGKSFMLNECGFPMNDIMMYEQTQSDSVAEAVLKRLSVLTPADVDQNLTPSEMFSQVVPANYGSPAEFARLQKKFAVDYLNRVQAHQERLRAAAVRSTKKVVKPDSTVTVEPE